MYNLLQSILPNDRVLKALQNTILSELGRLSGKKIFFIESANFNSETQRWEIQYSEIYPPNFPDYLLYNVRLNFLNFYVTSEDIYEWNVSERKLVLDIPNSALQIPEFFVEETPLGLITENETTGLAYLRALQFPLLCTNKDILKYFYFYQANAPQTLYFDIKHSFLNYVHQLKTTTDTNQRIIDAYYNYFSGSLWVCEPPFLFKRGLVYYLKIKEISKQSEVEQSLELQWAPYLGALSYGYSGGKSYLTNGLPQGSYNYDFVISETTIEPWPTEKIFTIFNWFVEAEYIPQFITSWSELFKNPSEYTPAISGCNWWLYNKNKLTIKHSDCYSNQNIPGYGNIFFKIQLPDNKHNALKILNIEQTSNDFIYFTFYYFNTAKLPVEYVHLERWRSPGNIEDMGYASIQRTESSNVYTATFSGTEFTPDQYVRLNISGGLISSNVFVKISNPDEILKDIY
jgi:hypothetical protein